VLNQIVFDLPPEHPLSDSRPLKEFLGHTPPQVSLALSLTRMMKTINFSFSSNLGKEKFRCMCLTCFVAYQVAAGAMLGCLIAYTLHVLSLVTPPT
jgi:acid phosphatase family membrane protein YuiD